MSTDNPWKTVGDVFLKLISRAANSPSAMSDADWVVYRVWSLLGEVSNGGFDQYFFNSSGGQALPTLDALKAIGDTKAAAVLEKALKVFSEPPSPDRDRRWEQLDHLTKATRKKFEALDKELYDCGQDVVEKLAAYIRSHAKQIKPKKERGGQRHS